MSKIGRNKKILLCLLTCMLIMSSFLILKGCGGSETGHQNWTITALNSTLGAPSSAYASTCYSNVRFRVTDPQGNAVQGIRVSFQSGPSNAMLGLATDPPDPTCADAVAHASSALSQPTDNDGVVALEFRVAPTGAGTVFFIDATSGGATPAELKTAASVTTP